MDVINLPLGQIVQEPGVVYFRAPVGHFHMARTLKGGEADEQVCGATAAVFIVIPGRATGAHGDAWVSTLSEDRTFTREL